MDWVSDVLLLSGALGAALYCAMLSRRLRRFTDLEEGVGSAVAQLALQAEELEQALGRAGGAAEDQAARIDSASARAEAAARRLELLMASMHDLPEPPGTEMPERAPAKPVFIKEPAPARARG